MREAPVKEPKLAIESPKVPAHLSRLKTAHTGYRQSPSGRTTKYEGPAEEPPGAAGNEINYAENRR
jgi:hypothetical protein